MPFHKYNEKERDTDSGGKSGFFTVMNIKIKSILTRLFPPESVSG